MCAAVVPQVQPQGGTNESLDGSTRPPRERNRRHLGGNLRVLRRRGPCRNARVRDVLLDLIIRDRLTFLFKHGPKSRSRSTNYPSSPLPNHPFLNPEHPPLQTHSPSSSRPKLTTQTLSSNAHIAPENAFFLIPIHPPPISATPQTIMDFATPNYDWSLESKRRGSFWRRTRAYASRGLGSCLTEDSESRDARRGYCFVS